MLQFLLRILAVIFVSILDEGSFPNFVVIKIHLICFTFSSRILIRVAPPYLQPYLLHESIKTVKNYGNSGNDNETP